jgi:hypothetical protein
MGGGVDAEVDAEVEFEFDSIAVSKSDAIEVLDRPLRCVDEIKYTIAPIANIPTAVKVPPTNQITPLRLDGLFLEGINGGKFAGIGVIAAL